MTTSSASVAPLLLPTPTELASFGLDPAWSRVVTFDSGDGRPVRWHVLDTGPGPSGTIVCVHGNPTWSYLWRQLLTTLAPDWRVVAVDQTGMGFSERGRPRRLAQRIDDLVAFCRQEIATPFVLAAHDWGGPVAVGASASLPVEALILINTAVAKPDGVAVPPLIASARAIVDMSCRRTPAFIRGTAAMARRGDRPALLAPYRTASRREAIRDFVADIPVTAADPSYADLQACADALARLAVPSLLVWGGRDPVFHDRFLADLRRRLPHADVQRLEGANHLSPLDDAVGPLVRRWLEARHAPRAPQIVAPETAAAPESLMTVIDRHRHDESPLYRGPDGHLSWQELIERSAQAASALQGRGLTAGDRVALLIPPSCELLVATVALWRRGLIPVVVDTAAGLSAIRRLLRAQGPRAVLGTRATLALAALAGFAPGALRAGFLRAPSVIDLRCGGAPADEIPAAATDVAAIVHTSGSTGPAKAVRYTHGALGAQRLAMRELIDMSDGEAFCTSFGPFMLLAPSLERPCIRPDFDVSSPAELDFDAFTAAVHGGRARTAWLSPASAQNILATAHGRPVPLRLVLLAGAPISRSLVADMQALTGADVRAPYGMTECLPVTDGTQPQIEGPHGGNAVGRPLPGCRVEILPLSEDATDPGFGEICVCAPWMFDGYDGSWQAEQDSVTVIDGVALHRTGDVGYLCDGLLFHLGRRQHVIFSASGPVASVAAETPVAEAIGRRVAAVGIGPRGAQVLALVVENSDRLDLAPVALRTRVRDVCGVPVAAVLQGPLPLDRRHQSKIDRTSLGRDVAELLAGR